MAHHRSNGLDARIVRIFNTYGPRMRADDGRVIPQFITYALSGAPLPVHGDGRQTRSFCFVDDLADGIYRLATCDGLAGEVVNLGPAPAAGARQVPLHWRREALREGGYLRGVSPR